MHLYISYFLFIANEVKLEKNIKELKQEIKTAKDLPMHELERLKGIFCLLRSSYI